MAERRGRGAKRGKIGHVPSFNALHVEQHAASGAAPGTVAIALGINYEKLTKKDKEIFDQCYEKGHAVGVQRVFQGLRDEAANGDTGAAKLFFEYTGIQPVKRETPDSDKPTTPLRKRLVVEVEEVDNSDSG